MTGTPVAFDRPPSLQASEPPEQRGAERDGVRLMMASGATLTHHLFSDLPDLLEPGDLLVVNRSATLPASLPAQSSSQSFVLNLSTRYGPHLWLAEPRWSASEPGPVPLMPGDRLDVAGSRARIVGPHPRFERLTFVAFDEDAGIAMARAGSPIRYGHIERPQPLDAYQTVFADRPGSAEMPSAARPFTARTVRACRRRGIDIAKVTLHTGVSSLEAPAGSDGIPELYAEPFEVHADTAATVNRARAEQRRVIAVGTTVVRALESAWDGRRLVPSGGFTRRVVRPGNSHGIVDGLITGLHDSGSSHLAMLCGLTSYDTVSSTYREALARGYLWHEFGDVQLLWTSPDEPLPASAQAGV